MKKKMICVLLALIMCVGLKIPAFATDEYGQVKIQGDFYLDFTFKPYNCTILFEEAKSEKKTIQIAHGGPDIGWPEAQPYRSVTCNVITVRPGSNVQIIGAEAARGACNYIIKSGVDYSKLIGVLSEAVSIAVADDRIVEFGTGGSSFGLFDGPISNSISKGECAQVTCFHGDSYELNLVKLSFRGDSNFSDVISSSPYFDAIQWAVKQEITDGTSTVTFSPNSPCSRAQIITFIHRAQSSPVVKDDRKAHYSDVNWSNGSYVYYYFTPALWAKEQGLVSDSAFTPDKPCTRAEVVTYLWKLAGSPRQSNSFTFSDVSANAIYAQAVSWAVETGITEGTGGAMFNPDQICTRGQIVTFLYRFYSSSV